MFVFTACERKQCVNITIKDDSDNEEEEMFYISLESPPHLHPNISLNPAHGEVIITDNDG